MTRYQIPGTMILKLSAREKREGADDINGTILARKIEPGTVELMDPKTFKWYRFTDCVKAIDRAAIYCEGEEPLPTYAEQMSL